MEKHIAFDFLVVANEWCNAEHHDYVITASIIKGFVAANLVQMNTLFQNAFALKSSAFFKVKEKNTNFSHHLNNLTLS